MGPANIIIAIKATTKTLTNTTAISMICDSLGNGLAEGADSGGGGGDIWIAAGVPHLVQ
jgi:hypothetical protein